MMIVFIVFFIIGMITTQITILNIAVFKSAPNKHNYDNVLGSIALNSCVWGVDMMIYFKMM